MSFVDLHGIWGFFLPFIFSVINWYLNYVLILTLLFFLCHVRIWVLYLVNIYREKRDHSGLCSVLHNPHFILFLVPFHPDAMSGTIYMYMHMYIYIYMNFCVSPHVAMGY
ncbi:hypothetical protein BGX38DRAFT_539298 [Terfezia claveryi]|nr:hypothetical protein BGX38DRAFT_539298 [Terfezia claveryi]